MKMRMKSLFPFIAALLLGGAGVGFSQQQVQTAIEAGDTISIAIPFENKAGGITPIRNVRLVVAQAPAWIEVDTVASFMGPVDIYPGELITFNLDSKIADFYNPAASAGNIILNLVSDSTSYVPSGITWSFATSDGFRTMRGTCAANDGNSCGNYIAPDTLSPGTYLVFDGPVYEADANTIYLSTHTLINFIGSDAFGSDEVISRAAVTGYSVFAAPAAFEALNFSTVPITLAPGANTLYYASRDYAGNTEVIKSTTVIVDGTAPEAPLEVKADSVPVVSPWKNVRKYTLTWNNPPDLSGIAGARVKFGDPAPVSNDEGVFYPAAGMVVYSSTMIENGGNVLRLWLEDNVGNSRPGTAAQVTLRYDDEAPVSTASAAAFTASGTVRVEFGAVDATSGVDRAELWWSHNGAAWSSGAYVLAGSSGAFSFVTGGAQGNWAFYTRAADKAGNYEPIPGSTTPAKASSYVDVSTPIFSSVRVTDIKSGSARVSWETDDETTGVLEYSYPGGPAGTAQAPAFGAGQNLVLSGLVYPANYTFRITVTNKTGLTAVYTGGSFYVPPLMTTNIDGMGVLDVSQPIVIEVTNPYVSSVTYTFNGETATQPVSPGAPAQIYAPAVPGEASLSLSLGDYAYAASFVVDTAIRTARLARLVIDGGGLMSSTQAASVMDATLGQAAQAEMETPGGGSKLYLGYYAGIDPVAPAAISTLAATAGPQAGQVSLSWAAPGDDDGVGTAMKYAIHYSTVQLSTENFKTALPAPGIPNPGKAGTNQALTISGLANGTTYYFAIKTFDELLNWSFSNVASRRTLELARSTALVGGYPAVEVVSSFSGLSIVQVSTNTQETAFGLAVSSALGQGLVFYGGVFDINPSRTFTEDAQLSFRYPDPGDAVAEEALALYRYDPAQGKWEPLPGEVDRANNIVRAITHSFSLYAVLGRDTTPPATMAALTGGARYMDAAGNIYLSGDTKMTLTAADGGGGVSRSEYRLDSAAGPFEVYQAPVQLPEGWHTLQYRSVDKAGNIETLKSLFAMKDALPPRIEFNFAGQFARLPGGVIHISSTSGGLDISVLDYPSSGSGLKKVTLELDGVQSEIGSEHSIPLYLGRHDIKVRAEDNVGNIIETKADVVVGDLLPPIITAPINNFAASGSTVAFSWQHQTTNFFSLTEYDLLLGGEPGFATPEFVQVVSSQVKVTVRIDEAGLHVQGLEDDGSGAWRLITEQMAELWSGALEGVMETPAISLPNGTIGISSFTVIQAENEGGISHDYRYQAYYSAPTSYQPITPGGGVSMAMSNGGWISFRSTLRRNALKDKSPTLTVIEFVVTYRVWYYNSYCHRHGFSGYHCHNNNYYYDYSNQKSASALSAVSHEGLRFNGPALELITEPGALTGEWLSEVYPVPDGAYRIGDLLPDYDVNNGAISFEFSRSSGTFRPIGELEAAYFRDGDTLQFKAIFSRATSSDPSPVFRGVNFNFIAPPPTGTEFALPAERKYYWRVAAKDYLGRFSAPSEERLVIYDTHPPLTEHLLAGATGQDGWHISPITASLTSTDAVAGVGGTYYSVNGSSFALYTSPFVLSAEGTRVLRYYSEDSVGNKEAEKTVTERIDLSSPTILSSVTPAPNPEGWNKISVGVVFTGSDTVSGLAYCTSSATVVGEGVDRQVVGACFDNAGLSSTRTVSVSIDTTPPSIQYSSAPWPNEFGWNSSTVTLTFACADVLSDVKTCPAPAVFTLEGVNLSTSVAALDKAGNQKTLSAGGIKIDKTPPVSSSALAGAIRNNWYSSPVAVTLASTDVLSGVRQTMYSADGAAFSGYQQTVNITEDGLHNLRYYATDKAGNFEVEKSTGFRIDRTAPQVGYAINPPPNQDGWNKGAVSVIFSGTDTMSGVEICSQTGASTEGAERPVAGWCRDLAGNQGYSTATVKIDLTSPTVYTAQSPLANADGWNNGPVTVIFSGDDQLSHIAYCTSAPPISDEGSGLAAGSCADKAGNTTYASRTVNIDKTAPVTTAVTSGTLVNDWYTTPAAITLAPADALSGVKQANYTLVRDSVLVSSGVYVSTLTASADGQYVVYYNAVDKAGNTEAGKSTAFKIDRTAPVLSISSPAAGQSFIATRGNISVKFGVTDNLDPAPLVGAWLEQVEDRGSPRGARPTRLAVSDGQAIEPLGIDDGIWRLTVSATDFADNAALLSGGTFEVIHDVLAPRTGHSLTAGPSLVAGATTYIAGAARLELTSIDDLVLAGDGIGLGVKEQAVRLWSGSSLVKELSFTNPAPGQGEAFTSSFTGAGLGLADGSYSLAYNAADVLGTVEAGRSITIGLDNTAPVSTAALAGMPGENGWHVSTVTVSLSAVDALSGVAVISYKLDNNALLPYTSAFETAAEGQHTVKFYGKDRLGNTETEKSAAFKIDRTAPTIVPERFPAANVHGWNNTGVTVSFTCSDAVSGVQFCPAEAVFSVEGFGQAVSGTVRDYAGHASSASVGGINIDKTQPASSLSVFGELWESGSYKYLNPRSAIALAATDGLSGVEAMEYHVDEDPFGVYSSSFSLAEGMRAVHYHAIDKADNMEATRTALYRVDGTGPATFLKAVGGSRYSGPEPGSFYASLASRFTLEAADTLTNGVASGVRLTSWSDNGGAASNTTESLAFAEGRHVLAYWSMDNVDNQEVTKSTTILVDNTAPVTTHHIGSPYHAAGGVNYITPATPLTFTAGDPVSSEVASGVSKIEVSLNGSPFGAYSSALKFNEGRHTIKYRAIDKVGNVEAERIIEVLSDNTAPVSRWSAASGNRIERGNKFYLNALGRIAFESVDSVINEVASGVEGIYYGIDAVSGDKYAVPIGLAEGVRTIKFSAKDNVGNTEVVKSTVIYVDGTNPVTELSISGDQYKSGRQYISRRTDIVIAAADPVVSEVSVGVREIKYAVDGVAFSDYSQFKLSAEGRRLVSFYSADYVSNVEAQKTAELWVDGTAPLSVLDVLGGKQSPGAEPGSFYASQATRFGFVSVDPVVAGGAAGVKAIEYADNGGISAVYAQPISLGEGRHSITYRATDQVENIEVFRSTQIYIDNTAPVTSFSISEPLYIKDGVRYITPASALTFIAADPLVSEVSAGVEHIETAVDGGQWLKYTQALKFAEGRHTIKYRAIDNVGNTEAERVLEVRSDATPPVTGHQIGIPYYVTGAGVNYITPETPLTFSANDPVTSDVTSGVERIETSVDGGVYASYTAAMKFPEGRHTIKYRAYDNVGNLEAAHTLEVQSDSTAPDSRWLPASGPWIEKDNKFYLNVLGSIALESADPVRNNVAAGLENIYYGIDAAPSVKYTAVFSLAEGVRTVSYSAKDNLGNTELVKSTVVYVDGTKPASALSLSGDQYNGDKQYISQRTDIIITAADPAVNDVAVGVKETKYSVDGAAFVNYSLFKLSAEGKRLVSYYSTDFVSNIEMAKTTALWVDNTPPSTELSIAGALYTTPGDEKLYITRDSGIVLTSSDPVSNDTASGVMLTKYRIDGGNWLVYSGSFTIAAEGLHTLEYYALDRVQNAEVLKSAKIAVDNTPPVTGISLGEPKSEVFGLPVLMQNTPITLAAVDPVMNSVSAGLNSIFYELENAQTGVRSLVTAYTSPFTITEQGTFIIRYWSKDNTGNTETPKEKMAAVTTWRADGLIAASGLDMSGTADISGSVKSNAIVSLGGNARILGDVTASTITLTGKAQITGLQINGAVPVNPAPIYLAGIVQNAATVNNNALVAAYLVDGKLALSSKVNLTLSTGTYYFKGMDLSGGSSITISGKVDILVEGGITINGGSSMNADGEASRLAIIVSTASELKFNGGGALAACVYAPYSDLKLTGNALLGGHYFVKTAAVSGTGNLLQSGEALPVPAATTGGGPKTKAAAMPGSRVGVLAGPDPEFKLGEVYVFPNPSKGTEAPVFHIETGIADSVKITIYTISGRMAHEQTLAGLPAELDDGNGLSYAYEYTWRGHIPSGIYLYSIEAQKSGQKLKKTGKFGVVR